jgi:hypothetical protein
VRPYLQKSAKQTKAEKRAWLKWLEGYGAPMFLEAFLRTVENVESECVYCHEKIYVDVLIGGGVPDWSTEDGDFGCVYNPDNSVNMDEGVCGHAPKRRPA